MSESNVRYVSYGMCAGSTIRKFSLPSPPAGELEAAEPPPKNSWSECDAATFHLRVGPNYDTTKAKVPSAPPLYDLVGVE